MEDTFGFIIKQCKPTASQEEKLRTCPFARESETFPDLPDSLASFPASQPPEPAVVMLSIPDSDSVTEEFQTPPEHAYSSSQPYLSGSEDLRPPSTAAAAIDSQSDSPGGKQDTVAGEDCADPRGIVDLGTECDDLGFSEARVNKGQVSTPEGSDSANTVRGSEDFDEPGLDDEPASKRIRVSQEDLGVESPTLYVGETEVIPIEIKDDDDSVNNTDVIDLENEEAGEKEKIMANLDSPVNSVVVYRGSISKISPRIVGSKRMDNNEELAVVNSIGEAENKGICDDVASAKEKDSDAAIGKRKHGFASAKEKHSDVANRKEKCDIIVGSAKEKQSDVANIKGKCDVIVGSANEKYNDAANGKRKHDFASEKEKHINVANTKEKCDIIVGSANEKYSDAAIGKRKHDFASAKEKQSDVANGKGKHDFASAKEKHNDVANRKEKCGIIVGSAKEKHIDIANIKEKCDNVGRRELPLSMKIGEKSTEQEEEIRRVDLSNGSFKNVMEVLGVLFGKPNDACKEESLLEIAEKRGWVFPKPRWWPPEGFDD